MTGSVCGNEMGICMPGIHQDRWKRFGVASAGGMKSKGLKVQRIDPEPMVIDPQPSQIRIFRRNG